MTARQLEICVLLRDLGKPVELIAVQSQVPVEIVRDWLRTGVCKAHQLLLFDRDGWSPRPDPMTKPATTASGHGLSLFKRAD